MRRRSFLTLLGGAAATWPVAARAQQPAMPVIGFLGTETRQRFEARLRAFLQGLGELGYVDGQNVLIEYRWANGEYAQLPSLADDLVRLKVNVIVTYANVLAALAAKAATATIPIVFQTGVDPVARGLVSSLNRPGGNLTGISTLTDQLAPKKLEMLHQVIPSAARIAVLLNPANAKSGEDQWKDFQAAARTLGNLELRRLDASTEMEFDAAFNAAKKQRVDGVVIGAEQLFTSHGDRLAALALQYALPAIAGYRSFAAAGGLLAYGGTVTEPPRQVGIYTGRILKGEKPADLPVQQITKVEFIVNLKTAKTLGLTIPLPLLGRADEVIE